MHHRWVQGIPPAALAKVGSPALQQFISLCITHDRNARPYARELLKHPFFDSLRNGGEGSHHHMLASVVTQGYTSPKGEEPGRAAIHACPARDVLLRSRQWTWSCARRAGQSRAGACTWPHHAPVHALDHRLPDAANGVHALCPGPCRAVPCSQRLPRQLHGPARGAAVPGGGSARAAAAAALAGRSHPCIPELRQRPGCTT